MLRAMASDATSFFENAQCRAAGWLAACAAYYRMATASRERLVAAVGAAIGAGMIVMKITPAIPGHFNGYEWLALTIWALIGVGLAGGGGRFRLLLRRNP